MPQEPPCKTCFPGIHEYNVDTVEIYSLVDDQYIMGYGGPVGINIQAVGYVLDNFHREIDKLDTIARIKVISNSLIARIKKDSDNGKTST